MNVIQKKANDLYNTCFSLYEPPKDILQLEEINKEINQINIRVCEIMIDFSDNRYLWRKVKELLQNEY